MFDERWNPRWIELAAIDLGGPANCRASFAPLGRNIQGVVFEPCDVLYDDSAWRRWFWQLAARMGLSSHYTPFFRAWDCEFQEAVWSGQLDLFQALGQFLRSAGMSPPDIDEVIAASRAKFRRFDQDTRPFPDVHRTVRKLRDGGMQIAVMPHSRLNATKLPARLDRVGIGHLVTRILSNQDVAASTDRAAWQQAMLADLPGSAANWAFVARRQVGLDLAHCLGMLTVAFNHDADTVADVHIEQFSQLGQLLHRQGSPETGSMPAKAA